MCKKYAKICTKLSLENAQNMPKICKNMQFMEGLYDFAIYAKYALGTRDFLEGSGPVSDHDIEKYEQIPGLLFEFFPVPLRAGI